MVGARRAPTAAAHLASNPPAPPPQAGFVHRDIRSENVTCDDDRKKFFLIDLEAAGAPGPVEAALTGWKEAALEGERL